LYLSRHGLQTVETWDLQKAIIDATGINMDWFFDQWIHRGGEPIYAVNWNVHANLGDNNSANVNDLFPQGQYDIEINVKQTQNQDIVVGLFRMPVDIEFLYFDGSSEKRTVWVDKSQHSFHFKTQKAPMTVVFDAGSRILKTLEMQKSPAEWLFQMEHGSSMLDRYDALVALRGIVAIHSPEKQKRLSLNPLWSKFPVISLFFSNRCFNGASYGRSAHTSSTHLQGRHVHVPMTGDVIS
jgi:aminopeptidase N